MKGVIYTAIFGDYDHLCEPEFRPEGWNFVCFTDNQNLTSETWDVRVVDAPHQDPTRSARMYKVLPHHFVNEYETSIWVDGNIVVRGDVNDLVETYLRESNIAIFDHEYTKWDSRDCLYEEAEMLIDLTESGRRHKDDPGVMRAQIERYRAEGYPEHNGLISSMELVRRHNEEEVVDLMEGWWEEISNGSKRDQLSFNFVAWKQGTQLCWLPWDSRDNPYFKHVPHKKDRISWWGGVLRAVQKLWQK